MSGVLTSIESRRQNTKIVLEKEKKSRFDCRLARYPNEIGRNAINRMHGSMSIAKIDFQFSLAGRAIITRGYYQTNYT